MKNETFTNYLQENLKKNLNKRRQTQLEKLFYMTTCI